MNQINLARKIYPDKLDREDANLAIEMIVATERFMRAENDYNDAEKKIRDYLRRENSNFPGHFLIPINNKILSDLKNLTNLTFGKKDVKKI